jgi:hypothetical protein
VSIIYFRHAVKGRVDRRVLARERRAAAGSGLQGNRLKTAPERGVDYVIIINETKLGWNHGR